MFRRVNFIILAIAVITLSSCGAARVTSPLSGAIFTNVKSPIAVTSNSNSTKVGKSEAISILGLAATGDASIEAAAKSAGITKIHHVDASSMSVLGIYAKYEVFVYGE